MVDTKSTNTVIKYNDFTFSVSGKLDRVVNGFPFHDNIDKSPRFRFTVTVKNVDTNIQRSFRYYTSIVDYRNHKDRLDERDLINAFSCFIQDAITGLGGSFNDFCSEFGYEQYGYDDWGYEVDNKNSKGVYDQCVEARWKADDLGISENELYNIIGYLQETYDV